MDTRGRITHIAFISFLENGYKGTTYSQLIEATDVSKGAFYHYFQNKEELFFEVIDTYFGAYLDRVDWPRYQGAPLSKLEKGLQGHYGAFTNQIIELTGKGLSRYFILFFEALDQYPAFREKVRQFYRDMRETLDVAIAADNGTKPKLSDTSKALNIIAHYEGLLFWQAIFPEQRVEDLIDT